MKKLKLTIAFLIFIINIDVFGTSGAIKQDSIIKCNGKYYGNHGNPTHFHIVEKKDGKWVSVSNEVEIPSCYIEPINEKELVKFSKCVDGDTARFIINGEEKTVRFLAIDTPESNHPEKEEEPFSKEASNYTCNLITRAKEIYLEYDGNSDKEDKFGRILAFVIVDGELLEEKLIENGLAKVAYIYGDYAHLSDLRKKEAEAMDKKIGIWSEDANIGDISNNDENSKSSMSDENNIIKILRLIIELVKKIFDLLLN